MKITKNLRSIMVGSYFGTAILLNISLLEDK